MINALTGGQAAAEAVKQINPGVVAAYPITPQTPIIETFAQFVANGKVQTELVLVESEHSALSAVTGAQATGVRAMTATASQGLALMHEVLGVTAGMRLPVVMHVANRALSAPINIHCDHSDTMASRDMGWIQIYSENPQEVYDHTFLAMKLAEDPGVQLPAMVCQDGFICSHCVEGVETIATSEVQRFIGTYRPRTNLADKSPVTLGALALPEHYFEIKNLQSKAMQAARTAFPTIAKQLTRLTHRHYPYFEQYRVEDAQVVLVGLGSTMGTARVAVDKLRKQDKRVGVLKIRLFRPFPYSEIASALKTTPVVGVLDRSLAYGGVEPLLSDVTYALSRHQKPPRIEGYTYGLGGADAGVEEIEEMFDALLKHKI